MRALPLVAIVAAVLAAPAARAEDPKEIPPKQPNESAATAERAPDAKASPPAAAKGEGGRAGAQGGKPDLKVRTAPPAPEKKDPPTTKPCEEVRPCSID